MVSLTRICELESSVVILIMPLDHLRERDPARVYLPCVTFLGQPLVFYPFQVPERTHHDKIRADISKGRHDCVFVFFHMACVAVDAERKLSR